MGLIFPMLGCGAAIDISVRIWGEGHRGLTAVVDVGQAHYRPTGGDKHRYRLAQGNVGCSDHLLARVCHSRYIA